MVESYNDAIQEYYDECINEHKIYLMRSMKSPVDRCCDILLREVDNVNANEQCFKHLTDIINLPKTHEFLDITDITELVNDNEWIDLVNKLLIKQLKCH